MPYVANNYKDRLFNFIFGSEENKEWTLSLYNAMNGTSYRDPSMIEINTIKEVLYLGMHNDVSFLITPDTNLVADTALLNLYEQRIIRTCPFGFSSTLEAFTRSTSWREVSINMARSFFPCRRPGSSSSTTA